MSTRTATSVACANIAFIKYWGNRDNALRLPSNGSISMNLDGLFTRTTVTFNSSQRDSLLINDHAVTGKGLDRVSYILDLVRGMANMNERAEVSSTNNFPAGAGIASSAAAFAALALASSRAAGLDSVRGAVIAAGATRLGFRITFHSQRICRMDDGHWRR